MITVIFGAGASYDYYHGLSLNSVRGSKITRPPLAKNLFNNAFIDELIQAYPATRPLIEQLEEIRNAHQRSGTEQSLNIEDELERIRKRSERNNNIKHSLLNLRFLVRDVIDKTSRAALSQSSGRSNYSFLVRELGNWSNETGEQLRFITFNYDKLLEEACSSYYYDWNISQTDDIDDYIKRDDIKIVKLHGSIDWYRTGISFIANPTLANFVDQEIDSLPLTTSFAATAQNEFRIPAIALPFRSKNSFECPDRHLQIAIDSLATANKVVVVGWSGAEPHFLQKVIPNKVEDAELFIVSGSPEGRNFTLTNLQELGFTNRVMVDNGFSKFISSNDFKRLIKK